MPIHLLNQGENRLPAILPPGHLPQLLPLSLDGLLRRHHVQVAAREGELRLIRVEDFDLSPCGGTHVNRTGSIGLIAVRKIERMKGQTRVEFVCAGRALACARRDFRILSEAGRSLSSAPEKLPELVSKQSDEIRGAAKTIEKLSHRVAEYRGRELWAAGVVRGGIRIVRHILNGDEAAEAKMVAQAAASRPQPNALSF